MGSLLRSVKKRKKSRRLGEVEMVRHEDYGELALDAKEEMIRSLVPVLCQNSAQPASTKELRLSKSGKTLAREQVTQRPPTLDCGSTSPPL